MEKGFAVRVGRGALIEEERFGELRNARVHELRAFVPALCVEQKLVIEENDFAVAFVYGKGIAGAIESDHQVMFETGLFVGVPFGRREDFPKAGEAFGKFVEAEAGGAGFG